MEIIMGTDNTRIARFGSPVTMAIRWSMSEDCLLLEFIIIRRKLFKNQLFDIKSIVLVIN